MRETIEAEVIEVLDTWMAAFNRLDIIAWEKTFHFPHYRLASGNMRILNKPGEQDVERMRTNLTARGWHHSGWDRRNIVHISESKVHVDTQFTRYRADGSVIAAYESLYVLTYEEGRWGIKLRSSFAP